MCPPGYYCEGEGNSEPTGLCDAGWFCTGGAYEARPIVIGNYSTIDICSCLELNMTGGKCQPGFYCPEGSSAPISCTAGMYCADAELDTPTGKFSSC